MKKFALLLVFPVIFSCFQANACGEKATPSSAAVSTPTVVAGGGSSCGQAAKPTSGCPYSKGAAAENSVTSVPAPENNPETPNKTVRIVAAGFTSSASPADCPTGCPMANMALAFCVALGLVGIAVAGAKKF